MDHLNELIAENLKDIRKGKGLSLEQVSSLTTISKSMLSQLERGEVNPTISTVYKLALGLKVPVTAFTADKPQPFFETGKKEVEPLAGDDGRYRLYPIFSFREGQDFEIFDLEFDENGNLQFKTEATDSDFRYDEIGSVLKIKQLQQTKRELFESLETFYRVFYLGEE